MPSGVRVGDPRGDQLKYQVCWLNQGLRGEGVDRARVGVSPCIEGWGGGLQ